MLLLKLITLTNPLQHLSFRIINVDHVINRKEQLTPRTAGSLNESGSFQGNIKGFKPGYAAFV